MALNIVVGIPTVGRASILRDTLVALTLQTRRADRTIVCGSQPSDVTGATDIAGVEVLMAEKGLPRQRNALITAAEGADVMVFFDDDFIPDPDYLAAIERHMEQDPTLAVATGRVLADGIGGPGLTLLEANTALAEGIAGAHGATTVFSGYGCNMAVRLTMMRAHHLWFDERLPLYGWQEDVDLSRRLAEFGTVMRIEDARGVHLGTKQGRNSGVRLGYSQVANPLYLAGKHAGYPLGRALEHIGRNMAMNMARFAKPEPYVDRRGRLRGNLLALRDLISRRMAPERVLSL